MMKFLMLLPCAVSLIQIGRFQLLAHTSEGVGTTAAGAYSLIGGGDSAAAVQQMGFGEQVSYISTGGGALLEYMEGKELPGVAALEART